MAKLKKAAESDAMSYAFSPAYKSACLEAAYRLIESSPTLRREWFGKAGGR
jgi:hypothetical protein